MWFRVQGLGFLGFRALLNRGLVRVCKGLKVVCMGFLQVSTKRMLTEKQNQSASAVFWSSLDPTLRSFRLCPDQTLEFPTTPWWCKPGRRPREESHPGRQGFGGSDCHATVAAISACCYSCHHCGDVAASTLPASASATASIAATTAITSSFVSAFNNYPQGVIVVSLLLGPLAIVSLMLSRFPPRSVF